MEKITEKTWEAEFDGIDLVIYEEHSGLEIVIANFDSKKTIANSLGEELLGDLMQLSIEYPLEETYLQIIITGEEKDKFQMATLHYGTNISWKIPIEFAKQLFTLS